MWNDVHRTQLRWIVIQSVQRWYGMYNELVGNPSYRPVFENPNIWFLSIKFIYVTISISNKHNNHKLSVNQQYAPFSINLFQ